MQYQTSVSNHGNIALYTKQTPYLLLLISLKRKISQYLFRPVTFYIGSSQKLATYCASDILPLQKFLEKQDLLALWTHGQFLEYGGGSFQMEMEYLQVSAKGVVDLP